MAASDPGHGAELFVADGRNNRIAVFSLDQLTSDAAARGPGGEGDLLVPFTRTIGGGPSAILGRFNGPSGVHVHKETPDYTQRALAFGAFGARVAVWPWPLPRSRLSLKSNCSCSSVSRVLVS